MIAFLGTGLLGSNFVQALLKKGETVQVWNRTFSKAAELEQYGAKVFENIMDAVKGATFVHLTLKDDETVEEVLDAASGGLSSDAIIIDHTTTSAAGAAKRTKQWAQQGHIYVHAPVFMGPKNALESTGYMLVSGDQTIIAQLEPRLSKMTGKVLNFGPEAGRAAGMKLIGNLFLITFTAGLSDVLSLAKAQSIPFEDLITLFNEWNPAATTLAPRLKKMNTGDFKNPSWELDMARKDTQLFLNATNESGSKLAVIPAIANLMDHWIAQGNGKDDWTIIGKGL